MTEYHTLKSNVNFKYWASPEKVRTSPVEDNGIPGGLNFENSWGWWRFWWNCRRIQFLKMDILNRGVRAISGKAHSWRENNGCTVSRQFENKHSVAYLLSSWHGIIFYESLCVSTFSTFSTLIWLLLSITSITLEYRRTLFKTFVEDLMLMQNYSENVCWNNLSK